MDERVKKNRDYLEKKAKEQYEMAEKQSKIDIKKNLEELSLTNYEITEEERVEHQKHLTEIEEALEAEFGTITKKNKNSDSENFVDDDDHFYCVICEKSYKNA